jgi:phosphoglycerate dehydrogenase-like enzyme
MKIYTNTSTLAGYDEGLQFTKEKALADIVLMGSKPISVDEFPNLKGIFRAGIGRDNVPEEEASKLGILVRFPSPETIDIIFSETAAFTCSLIFRMIYEQAGTVDPWVKHDRTQLAQKNLLVIGTGNIGRRVLDYMEPFMNTDTFDILINDISELSAKLSQADCVTLHIPKNEQNAAFMDAEKLGLMKNNSILINTARGPIVDENALYNELNSGRIRAAFDVFWQEPYVGILKEFFPQSFYMTPHIASTCSSFLTGCRNELDKLIGEFNHA